MSAPFDTLALITRRYKESELVHTPDKHTLISINWVSEQDIVKTGIRGRRPKAWIRVDEEVV